MSARNPGKREVVKHSIPLPWSHSGTSSRSALLDDSDDFPLESDPSAMLATLDDVVRGR